MVTRTNGLGDSTTYGYDRLDRPVTVTDSLTGTTMYGYDLAGNRTLMADPLGRTTVYTYDVANQQVAVGQADGSVLTTAYDAAGTPITATDALGKQTVYGYDSLNRVITTTDPLGRSTYASYDLAGNRTSLTDALGRVTTYGYDALDRTSAITYSGGATPNVRYTYTATGQRARMTDGTGATTYGYDALDRVITTTNGAGNGVGYGYDAVGNTTTITYPDGSQVTRAYDTLDRLSSVRDWLGHTARFGYDAADNLITQTLPTSTTTSIAMSYDAADRLAGITDTTPITTWSFAYTRDKSGEITAATDPFDGKAHRYRYDKLAGLTADSQGSSGVTNTVAWANDSVREVTQRLDPSGPYTSTLTYDTAHELTGTLTLSGTTPTKNVAYTYNKNGDRTVQTDSVGGASRTFGYDQADRLITATTGITQASYSYDGDGLRQRKTVTTTQGTTATAETWDTAEGLPALLQDGATRYIAGPDGLPLEQVNPDGSVQYYLHDQLGSTRALLDGAGHTVATYSYDAYGNPTVRTGSATTPFGYAGEYTDAETGFQYLQARYYDPATQQFVSVDPLVDQTGQPYAYTGDNPLNMVDPTGALTCGGVSGANWSAQRFFSAWGDTLCGVANGVGSGAHDTATGLAGTASFAWRSSGDYVFDRSSFDQQWAQTGETLCVINQDPGGAARTVWQGVSQPYVAAWQRGDYGYVVGRGEFDVLSSVVTAKGLDKLRYLAAAGRAGDVAGAVVPKVADGEADVAATTSRGDPVLCEGCFAAGTLVATPHGQQAIQTLRVGDKVLSEDPTTHKAEAEPVQRVLHDPASPLLAVDLSDGGTITTTLTHSFWVDAGARIARGGAWLWAEHLQPSDQLRAADGRLVTVVRVRTGVGQADVWTLTVARDHTFFVGTAQVLVHNSNCPNDNNFPRQLTLPGLPQVVKYEWHHPFPKYLGGAERQPLVALPDWYHDLIHSELDRTFPRWRGTSTYTNVSLTDKWRALTQVYNKYPLDIDPTTGQPFGWRK